MMKEAKPPLAEPEPEPAQPLIMPDMVVEVLHGMELAPSSALGRQLVQQRDALLRSEEPLWRQLGSVVAAQLWGLQQVLVFADDYVLPAQQQACRMGVLTLANSLARLVAALRSGPALSPELLGRMLGGKCPASLLSAPVFRKLTSHFRKARADCNQRVRDLDLAAFMAPLPAMLANVGSAQQRDVAFGAARDWPRVRQAVSRVVVGQDQAVGEVVDAIRGWARGERTEPLVLLLAGTSGVGKTETAKQLATALECGFARLDLNGFTAQHSVARLIGASAPYVGHDQEPEFVKQLAKLGGQPGLFLLDELEKAHADIQSSLMTAFDEGVFTTASKGTRHNVKHVVFLCTTNAGSAQATHGMEREQLRGLMRQAFASRVVGMAGRFGRVIPFGPLSAQLVKVGLQRALSRWVRKKVESGLLVRVRDADAVAAAQLRGYVPSNGVRPLVRAMLRQLDGLMPMGACTQWWDVCCDGADMWLEPVPVNQ